MRGWYDPWPSITDLFSSLLVACFAGLILTSFVADNGEDGGDGPRADPVAVEARHRREEALRSLRPHLGGQVRDCGIEDVCLDIQIQFATDEEKVPRAHQQKLERACGALRSVMRKYKRAQRNELQVYVEGHSDAVPPRNARTPRDASLYNWNLSARRATSVVYEFYRCGLRPPEYSILAIGYADSDPVCRERTPECYSSNRRTTFRLHADTRRIQERLKKENSSDGNTRRNP
jgi:flagellar motor protein MotB